MTAPPIQYSELSGTAGRVEPRSQRGAFTSAYIDFSRRKKKAARYQVDSIAALCHKGCVWLLDLGSNQGPTD
jgi:hypothetical protein